MINAISNIDNSLLTSNNSKEPLQKKENIVKVKEYTKDNNDIISEVKDINKKIEIKNIKYEQILSSNNFGYNSESKDFYIKVERGESVNQYPTDEMMKLKVFMKEQLNKAEGK